MNRTVQVVMALRADTKHYRRQTHAHGGNATCFGVVTIYDTKPKRRPAELLKALIFGLSAARRFSCQLLERRPEHVER